MKYHTRTTSSGRTTWAFCLLVLSCCLQAALPLAPSSSKNSNKNNNLPSSRRDFVDQIAITTAGGAVLLGTGVTSQPAHAASNSLPYCVIGANGRTGSKCVQALLERKIPVRATSRSGIYNNNNDSDDTSPRPANPLLTPMSCDVTDPSTVSTVVQGSAAVIFAASASKEGGTPAQVDNEGLVTVAKACIAAKVPHLVIVSSGGVSKPDSPVYKFLNVFGGIMEQKIRGEGVVRNLYQQAAATASSSGSTYTIVRPGGLTEEPPSGVALLELNQGDTKSGRISRFDVASICVESTLHSSSTGGTTFECYEADTGKPLGSVGLSNILKQKTTPDEEFITGKERRGKTWEDLFRGLEKA